MHLITDKERQKHGCEYCIHIKKHGRACPYKVCPYADTLDKYKDYFAYCKAGEEAWMRIAAMAGSPSERGANHSNARRVRCVETGVAYGCILDAADATGVHRSSIWAAMNGRTETAGGFHWEYCDL